MARSLSQDIRNEREELREAAAQTLNTIVDLNLDGTIKWVSPSWTEVVGTPDDGIEGTPMSHLIASENKNVFSDIVGKMKKDDSKSHKVRFSMHLGPLSKLRQLLADEGEPEQYEAESQIASLEAQGIMVYDTASGGESHVSFPNLLW
jgi:serine/threonine-protein kinase RIM15